MNYDILGLGELHNKQLEDNYKYKRWIYSEQGEVDEQGYDPDPAAGVTILLSSRMADRTATSNTRYVGSRIVWVRLAGPVYNIFVIVTYAPHRGRTKTPYVKDIIKQLQELLATVNKMDCVIMMGDLDCELQRNIKGCTGQWCSHDHEKGQ